MTRKLHINRKFITCILLIVSVSLSLFAAPYFNGSAGGGLRLLTQDGDTEGSLLADGYFSGQFDLSPAFFVRAGFSIYTTESLFTQPFFQNKEASFSLDEFSITYKNFLGSVSQYIGFYIGEYDTIGSDLFLQRQFGIDPFNSKLTETICGVNKSQIYDNSGIGGTYYIQIPGNLAFAIYAYYNTSLTASTSSSSSSTRQESLNTDLRFAGAWPSVALDMSLGFTMPMEYSITNTSGSEEDVILLIRRADMHMGLTAFFGSTNSSSLLFQTGINQLIIDPSTLEDQAAISMDNLFILVEPRFVTKYLCFAFTLYNMPLDDLSDLFYITNPTGVCVNFYSPWVLIKGNRCQFGMIAGVSCTETLDTVILDTSTFAENLELEITPYGITKFGKGTLNYSLSIECLTINSWETFLQNTSIVIGYKSEL